MAKKSTRKKAASKGAGETRKKAGAPKDTAASGLATEAEVFEALREHYPIGMSPDRVAYYLDEGWRRNLEARARAEQGQRFAEDLVLSIESEADLDVLERLDLVDRPAWLFKVLLHKGKRFREPVITDSFLDALGGEARLLDIWVSTLGPYYYARGYRLWPSLKEDLEGRPPPLDRTDRVALRAMKVAARTLRARGYRRVPGDVAKKKVPDLRAPGALPDRDPSVFELLFEGAPASPIATPPPEARPARPERDPPPRPEVEDGAELEAEVDVEMELFQQELEDELDKIRDEIEEVRRRRG